MGVSITNLALTACDFPFGNMAIYLVKIDSNSKTLK